MTQGDRDLIERGRTLASQSIDGNLRGPALQMADRIQALSADNEKLRDSLTGLTPKNLKAVPEWMSDFDILPLDVTAGELRRAYAALKGANNG